MSDPIESAVLDAIRTGANTLSAIYAAAHTQERETDRALQRLRKRGWPTTLWCDDAR